MVDTEIERSNESSRLSAVVFAGGLALATYHAGAVQRLVSAKRPLDWLAGSSAGAVTAALTAGGDYYGSVNRLERFWGVTQQQANLLEPWAHMRGWLDVARSHLIGNDRHFYPRIPMIGHFKSLYDLSEMRRRLIGLIDFDALNSGNTRVTIAATDLLTGDPVLFDTSAGPIGIDHIMASCGFLPEFAPVEIDGRQMVDGGLSLNAPFEPVLETDRPLDLFVIDLFARDGALPKTLERAAERKTDLMFGNQTFLRLKPQLELRALQHPNLGKQDRVSYLSYRAGVTEPGPEKSFNFAPDELGRRWLAGSLDMLTALDGPPVGLNVVRRPAK
jgi:NTE family protein